MKFSKDNAADLEFIEKWYSDVENGFKVIGKEYKRPVDYIERALRVMNNSKKRNKIYNQVEGKYWHAEGAE